MIIPDIARAVGRTVVENDKIGPVMAPWRAWPEDMQPDGVSRDTVLAPAAGIERGYPVRAGRPRRLEHHVHRQIAYRSNA